LHKNGTESVVEEGCASVRSSDSLTESLDSEAAATKDPSSVMRWWGRNNGDNDDDVEEDTLLPSLTLPALNILVIRRFGAPDFPIKKLKQCVIDIHELIKLNSCHPEKRRNNNNFIFETIFKPLNQKREKKYCG
jgi:hypothetical protein